MVSGRRAGRHALSRTGGEAAGVVKRSLTIRGHRTSISLEEPFWRQLQSIASARSLPLARLVADLDARRPDGTNLSSMLRVFVLEEALARVAEQRLIEPLD